MEHAIVVLDYHDLIADIDLSPQIEEAFGWEGLGILTVKNIPNLVELRSKLLPLAREFSALSDEVKLKYESPESVFSFGWSHGKEKLEGKPDLSKGSFYANPLYDRPVDDESIIAQYPAFVHPNIWPSDDLPPLEIAFKDLGKLIVAVGVLVAKQCDKYVKSRCESYVDRKLVRIIETSLCCKARLLHYFPREADLGSAEEDDGNFSSWCGWHNDHGSLTGLTSAMYMDSNGEIVENTDSSAGLYIRNRRSEVVKAAIPVDHIGFQIGETAQIHSGGILQATPHAVRGSKVPVISRETFAVFMEPNWDEPMSCPPGVDPSEAQSQTGAANLPPGVPTLASRWTHTQTFGDFTSSTLGAYY